MRRLWVCSYDIADPKRRYRTARALLGVAERVQESVFEGFLRAEQLPALQQRLVARMDVETDRAALYPVCADCQRRVSVLGLGRQPERPHFWCV